MAVEKGSLTTEIAGKRSRRGKIIEEIEAANEEIQTHNRAIAVIQERLKKLDGENLRTKMAVDTMMELNGDDPEPDIVPSASEPAPPPFTRPEDQ